MSTLLHINASPRGDYSISRQLSSAAVKAWKAKNPEGRVIERDLAKTALTFVDLNWIVGAFSNPETHTDEHKKALALSNELVDELLAADEIVIGTPMYNFAPPAALKAWIDHIVRAGKTFNYTASGVDGLAKGRKVLITIASGGNYDAGSAMAPMDHETSYLRFIFGFIGITDVIFVNAGGTSAVVQGKVPVAEFLTPFLQKIEAAV